MGGLTPAPSAGVGPLAMHGDLRTQVGIISLFSWVTTHVVEASLSTKAVTHSRSTIHLWGVEEGTPALQGL